MLLSPFRVSGYVVKAVAMPDRSPSKPVFVDTYGTGKKTNAELLEIVKNNFDLRPGAIVKDLDLFRPIYLQTAAYGHFGREGAHIRS